MNEPRRPDAQWIAEVRARNRAQLGLSGLGQREEEIPAWKFFLVLALAGYAFWKLS